MSNKSDVPVMLGVEDGLMTTREFADVVKVHTNTVRHWRKLGVLLPATQTAGGHARYNSKSIEEYKAMIAERQNAERLRAEKRKSK